MHREWCQRQNCFGKAQRVDRSAMRSVAFVSAVFVSVLAVSQSGVIGDGAENRVAPYSIIDPIIKAILEGLRPKLANLTIDDINQNITNPNVNGLINIRDISIKNADQFIIQALKSNLLPLKLTNLTLTWNNITAAAAYDIDILLEAPQLPSPIRLFAKGDARAILNNLFFTVGANVDLKGGCIQIKPKGLFGFDLKLESANVSFSSLMGSPELGSSLGQFLNRAIPDAINTLKKPIFDAFQDDIIKIVNSVLKKNGTSSCDDFQLSSYSAAAEEIDSFFGRPLDLSADLEDNEFNFNF